MYFTRVLRAALAILLLALVNTSRAAEDHPPVPIERNEPAYPYDMARKQISGMVMVEFVIGTDGLVKQAKVIRSSHQGFERAALKAILQWRFQPGIKAGKPVNVRAQQSLEFNMPKQVPVYPLALLLEGRPAKATLGFWLDENGRLKRSVVLETNDPVFGQAALAGLAAELAGRPASTPAATPAGMSQTTATFGHDRSADVSKAAREILKRLKKNQANWVSAEALDQPVTPIFRQPPLYPVNVRETHPTGSAVVEFFIDRQGQAQLPRVVSSSHEDFGYAAAQAIGQWRFKPPLQKGKPVIVRAQIPIEFNQAEPAAESE